MSLIISVEDIKNWEQLPAHQELWQRVQIRIKQAQDFDLPKVINQELIDDIVSNINSTEQKWVDLIEKVRPVMIYFAYARFLEWHDANVESFGFAKANTRHSEKLTASEKETLISRAVSLANGYGSKLITFLDAAYKADKTTYVNYKPEYDQATNQSSGLRIKAIGGAKTYGMDIY